MESWKHIIVLNFYYGVMLKIYNVSDTCLVSQRLFGDLARQNPSFKKLACKSAWNCYHFNTRGLRYCSIGNRDLKDASNTVRKKDVQISG